MKMEITVYVTLTNKNNWNKVFRAFLAAIRRLEKSCYITIENQLHAEEDRNLTENKDIIKASLGEP